MSMDKSGNTVDIANRAAEKIQREYANGMHAVNSMFRISQCCYQIFFNTFVETADKLLSDVSTVEMQKMLRSRLGRELTVDEICDCPEVLRDYLAADLIAAKRTKGAGLSSNVSNSSDDELSEDLLKKYSCCLHKRGEKTHEAGKTMLKFNRHSC